jgi:hypothetical protein
MPTKLLSDSQLAKIKSTILDVTYTFHNTPITIYLKSTNVWDGEDDEEMPERASYEVLCRISYGTNTSDSSKEDDTGGIDRNRMLFTVDTRNLSDVDFPLSADSMPLIDVADCYIKYNDRYYVLINFRNSGAFDIEQLLATFECDIEKYHTTLPAGF